MAVYDSKRRPIELGRQIGRGGESAIYHVANQPDYLIKIYTTPHVAVYEKKLTWMLVHPPDDPTDHRGHVSFAWPLAMLYDEMGAFVGYLRSRVPDAVTALKVFNPRLRTQTLPGFDRRYLYRTARNLAAAVEALHARDYVIGDLHESNVMVASSALVTLIDTDSFQVEAEGQLYPCIVGKPEYTPPELQGKSFRQVKRLVEHDSFSLGVLIFQLLMQGNHPFRGRWMGSGDPPPLEEKIRRGLFPYADAEPRLVAPPPTGRTLDTLHPEVADLMRRCFVDRHARPGARPTPEEWKQVLKTAEGNLVACPQGHYYSNYLEFCPTCRAHAAARRHPPPVAHRPVPDKAKGPVTRPTAPPAPPGPLSWIRIGNPRLSVLIGMFLALIIGSCFLTELAQRVGGALTKPTDLPRSRPTATPRILTSTPQLPSPQVVPRPTDLPPLQYVIDAHGVPMVFVPAGPFEMGSQEGEGDEQPVHTVTLDAFYIDQYEVTNAQFATFLNVQPDNSEVVDLAKSLSRPHSLHFRLAQIDGVWQADAGFANHPVTLVPWHHAQAYCEWRGGSLPTEAEWEKAARGTDGREYPWGFGIDCNLANYEGCADGTTAVGSYPEGASPYGAMDMAGNLWEWVYDWYQKDYYSVSPAVNPPGPDNAVGESKVLRGGAHTHRWYWARAARRGSGVFNQSTSRAGFRCATSDPAIAAAVTPGAVPPTIIPFPVPTPASVPVILIPAGSFEMGDEYHGSAQPIHTVTLDAYQIDTYEVTNTRYATCVQAGVCRAPGDCGYWGQQTYSDADKADHPVACVDWYDAQTYCEWRGGRLPTEAEWEKAARGTDGRTYPWGEDPPDCSKAQYESCGDGTVPVGSKPAGASPYGVHNMAGNVGEWVADWYSDDYYAHSPAYNPLGPDSGDYKARRGGDWFISADFLRTGLRFIEGHPGKRSNRVGFRCVTPVVD